MLLLNSLLAVQYNVPSFYKLAEVCSIEVFVGIMHKLLDVLVNVFIVLKLGARLLDSAIGPNK